MMKMPVRIRPMMPASIEASMASSPRVGPTRRSEISSSSRGSAPPSMRADRSLAVASVKSPVMSVLPVMLPPHCTCTSGLEMTSPSSTIAIRRWSPVAHAASPESLPKASEPLPLKSTATA